MNYNKELNTSERMVLRIKKFNTKIAMLNEELYKLRDKVKLLEEFIDKDHSTDIKEDDI